MSSVRFMLCFGSSGDVLAELDESSGPFLVGDVVEIKGKTYRVLGREWQIQQAGQDVIPESCSLVVWVKR